jgi:hypothetical protein
MQSYWFIIGSPVNSFLVFAKFKKIEVQHALPASVNSGWPVMELSTTIYYLRV